jgi:hypothetical protein
MRGAMNNIDPHTAHSQGLVWGGGREESLNAEFKKLASIYNAPVEKIYKKYLELERKGETTFEQYSAVWLAAGNAWKKEKRILTDTEIKKIIGLK